MCTHPNALGRGITVHHVALDWAAVAAMDGAEMQRAVLDESGAIMRPHLGSAEAEDRQLHELSEPLRAMWLINWLDYEVAQGSLLAYFYNSHGRHAPQAADLLDRMGARRMADVLREAMAAAGTSDADERLEVLTDRYWEAAEDDGWGDLLDAYLRREILALT